MRNHYEIVLRLATQPVTEQERGRMLNDFAYELGWHPSDRLDVSTATPFAAAHLVVEHGLENTAVITFLNRRYADLNYSERRQLLSVSYNNLVDWHVHVDTDSVSFVFNRTDPPQVVEKYAISRENFDKLRSEAFEQVAGRRPNPNLPALDNALIDTISFWKRNLSAELNYAVNNSHLSALFNWIIFARAVEDNHNRLLRGAQLEDFQRRTLLETVNSPDAAGLTISEVLAQVVQTFAGEVPAYLLNHEDLRIFDQLERDTATALIGDFYRNRYASYYEYDFSLISKHALSRIYEHYVSILRLEPTEQVSMFPVLPEEDLDRAFGNVYTPQFIARFFARFLREQVPPSMLRRFRVVDPACGSGIFLRTLLEMTADPTQSGVTSNQIEEAFGNVLGVDAEENATNAARLSLALLHLVVTGDLPASLPIYAANSLQFFPEHRELQGTLDAVFANPPFVPWDSQAPEMREQVSDFMAGRASGRVDTYLPFLLMGLDLLRPGGYGCFVLPHNFLLGQNARGMREELARECWIRCLVDLSTVRVFENVGAYVILLIFQKKPAAALTSAIPHAVIVRCQDLVGQALQDALEARYREHSLYSVYPVEQTTFQRPEWMLLPPTEASIRRKLSQLPTLADFLHVRQGFITGADKVFILPKARVPHGEEELYVPVLPDREMETYRVPESTDVRLFYPFDGDRSLSAEEIQTRFPKTWKYLVSRRSELDKREPVRKGDLEWWRPVRPRLPKNMMRPKIVTPHLVLVPRFSLDREGKFAVSHSPLLYPNVEGVEDDMLRYFVAVLNSTVCYWYISAHSNVYQRGYSLLEPKSLKLTPVPAPGSVPPLTMRKLLDLVEKRLHLEPSQAYEVDRVIDGIVADLYMLSEQERRTIGMT
jgi:type I restriction-modification system DNA methylase subunit